MAGVNGYKDGVVGRLYKGLTGLVKSRNITVVQGEGRLTSANTVEVDGDRLHRIEAHVVLATGSYSRSLPGPRHRRRADHHQRARADPRPRAGVGRRARRRRDRRRVRQRLEVLRRRGHDRRGAAAPGARARTSRAPSCSSARSAAAASTSSSACGSPRRRSPTPASRSPSRTARPSTAELLLVAVGRGPVSADLGYEEAGLALDRGFVTVDAHCRTNLPERLRGRRPAARPAARARRLRRGHHGRRARSPG